IELSNNKEVYLYPVNELIAVEMAVASPESRMMRIKALLNWLRSENGILIAPIDALKRMLPPKDYWYQYKLKFNVGVAIDVIHYLETLVHMGYERVDMVTATSEFSIRGGIRDMYPTSEKYPIRMELFGDEVDSIRFFDADSQRSLDKVQHLTVGPAKELLLSQEDSLKAAERLEKHLA